MGNDNRFILFHWSPIKRRKQIEHDGLCPGKPSRCGLWKPPYVCFSRSPSQAWGLSAMTTDKRDIWDLWMVWSIDVPRGYEILSTDGSHKPTEYRVYDRIKKSKIWYVGSRFYKP
jgi:hypothetical protein